MSKVGMHNFQGRNIGDSVVRSLALGRDLDRFLDDMGREPFTPEEAFEAASNGGVALWRRRQGRRWSVQYEMPAVGLDCLGALARGTQELENKIEDYSSSAYDFADSGCDDDFGPTTNVFWAFWEIDRVTHVQIEDAWDLHDCGFVPEDQMPVFLRRATPYEAALDLEERIRRARFEAEIRDLSRVSQSLSC